MNTFCVKGNMVTLFKQYEIFLISRQFREEILCSGTDGNIQIFRRISQLPNQRSFLKFVTSPTLLFLLQYLSTIKPNLSEREIRMNARNNLDSSGVAAPHHKAEKDTFYDFIFFTQLYFLV